MKTKIQTHKEAIVMYFDIKDNIKEVVKQYVQDTSIDLDERWEIFEKSDLGEHQSWIAHFDSLHDDICMYDGLVHVDRHQIVTVFDIVERYNDDLRSDDIEDWEKFGFDPVAFKEEALAKFIKSWEYDW